MTADFTPETLSAVREFWNAHPCGAYLIDEPIGTPEFFRKYAAYRYDSEFHLNDLVPFHEFAGKRMLEIGCGLGTDGARFAKNGATYVGIDLTDMAAQTTRQHFQTLKLEGDFLTQNAERLGFRDGAFDLVYSHGVLHHTTSLERALQEVHRVLRPEGKIIIMLYHRNSFNYYARIMVYHRLRLAMYLAARQFLPETSRRGTWEDHAKNVDRYGWRYFSNEIFPHHCTDGPDCPIANSYSVSELHRVFGPYFTDLRVAIAHFPIHNTLKVFPLQLEQQLARRFGWYAFVFGTRR